MSFFYWFKDKENVGDWASYYVVRKLTYKRLTFKDPRLNYKREVKRYISAIRHSILGVTKYPHCLYPWQHCLMAVGSILDYSNSRTMVWGSGFREYESVFHGGEVYAVRGYLSSSKLPKEKKYAIGDPALLLPLLIDGFYPTCSIDKYNLKKVAIVSHYYDIESLSSKLGEKYDIIDTRTRDVETFIKQIRGYDCVLSSSLHGIIFSHAFGIPALWIKNNYIASGPFKFHDYFSSVGIEQYDGFGCITELTESPEYWKQLFINNWDKSLPKNSINDLVPDLLKSFPFPLKKKYRYLVQ